MTNKHDKKKAINAEIAKREASTGGRFNGFAFEIKKPRTEPLWFEDWSYEVQTGGEDKQYQCIFRIPNAKAGPKEVVVTDSAIAMLMLSAYDTMNRLQKGEL